MGRRRNVEVQSLDGIPVGAKISPQTLATVQIAPIPADQPPILVAGYDSSDGSLRILNLRTLVEALASQESVYSLDKVDSRNGIQVTVPTGTAVGASVSGKIEVPTGEVLFINRLSVICPAADATGSASHNILVSSFPKTAGGTDKGYLATPAVAMGATTNYDLATVGQLGADLRLVGGDTLTLVLTATVAFTADKVFRLDIYGRRGKLLVPA